MKIFVVNAFAEDGFLGNPAGVCVVDEFPPDCEMKKIAQFAGFSETAFVQKRNRDHFFIRWQSPRAEVFLCGHATLAAAHIIFQSGHKGRIFFDSVKYKLSAEKSSDLIQMDFPADREKKCALPQRFLETFGAEAVYCAKSDFDYLVELKSEKDIARARPNLAQLKRLERRGLIITSASEKSEYDFVSRFFAPSLGIDEDPVTGSAHCCLAPYWSAKMGKKKLKGLQISPRGGVVHTELKGEKVKIGGKTISDKTLVF